MIKNMTEGSPVKILLSFSMPMLFSMMFQQFYNIVDSVVAGKFIGVDALAAIGASYPITVLFIAVANGASVGAAVVVSQTFGANKLVKMKTSVSTSVIAITVVSIALTIFGTLFCSDIMRMINTPENIFADSRLYLKVYIWGLIFLFMYNTATAIFTGLGDSKTPLYFLIFSSLLNVALDILFVTKFQMGVSGIAWATFL
uniref:MATE family efflux transporter n=1 Tax=uncultured Fusobacterium sp. TaxID=159267 RepID=UPI0028058CB2